MSKPTLILIIILFFFTGGLLILALNKSFYSIKEENQPPIPTIAIKNPFAPDTSLLFGNLDVASPSSYPKIYSLPVLINTGTNKVTTVQLELSFDPNILTNVTITPSNFFKNPSVIINKINNDIGRISYALAASNPAPDGAGSNAAAAKTASENASPVHATERGKQGEGSLATLAFESKALIDITSNMSIASNAAVARTSSTITFLPRTFVTAEGLDSSALKSTNSAELKFSN